MVGYLVFKKLLIENYDFGVVQNSVYALHLNHLFSPLSMAWLHKLSREMVVKNTRESYSSDLVKFYNFLLFNNQISKVGSIEQAKEVVEKIEDQLMKSDRALLESFAKYCINELGNSPSSVNRAFSTLIVFYKFLFDYGFTKHRQINESTTKGILGKFKVTHGITSHVRTQYISPEDFNEIILNQSWTKNKYAQARNELALTLRYKTGMRTFELVEYGNFDVSKLRKVIESNPKSGFYLSIIGKRSKKREIYIDADMALMLKNFIKRYLKDYKSGCIFTSLGRNKKPLKTKEFHNEAFKNAIRFYLDSNPNISSKDRELWENKDPYGLRHSFATNECVRMILNGEPYEILLKDLMGHENFTTTLNYILHAHLLISSHPERHTPGQIKHAQDIAHKVTEAKRKIDWNRGGRSE